MSYCLVVDSPLFNHNSKNHLVFRSIFINYYTWLSWKYHFARIKSNEIKTVWWSSSNSCIEVQIAKYITTALRYESENMFKISYQFNDMVWKNWKKLTLDCLNSGPFSKFRLTDSSEYEKMSHWLLPTPKQYPWYTMSYLIK